MAAQRRGGRCLGAPFGFWHKAEQILFLLVVGIRGKDRYSQRVLSASVSHQKRIAELYCSLCVLCFILSEACAKV